MREDTADGKGTAGGHPPPRRSWGALLAFVLLAASLHGLWFLARDTAVERAVIDGAVVHSAVALINAGTPQVQARADGSRIRADGGGINILNGCEGTEVLFLLLAALLVQRARWQDRVAGMLAGIAFVFAANQVRVLALFYSFRSDRQLFSQLHGTVTPLLLVAATLAFFLAWSAWAARRARPASA